MASRTVCFADRSTRRSATVTISAPEAARASRVWSLEAYLPVPTMMRERKLRAPRVQVSVVSGISASSHEGYDFEPVTGGELGVGVASARDDLAVAFDGDGAVRQTELTDECGDGSASIHCSRLSIYHHINGDRHRGEPTTTAPGWLAPGHYS